jgi:hypothetical protein
LKQRNNTFTHGLLFLMVHAKSGVLMGTYNRRDFLCQSLLGLAAVPLGASFIVPQAFAGELPRVDPADDQAQALEYVEDASQAEGHARWEEGQRCANCRFFDPDTEGCELFPGKSVEPSGWCNTWTEQA